MAKSKKLGSELSMSREENIEMWVELLVQRLENYGPRYIADLRKVHRNEVIDQAERLGFIQRVPVIGGHVLIPTIKVKDYRAWLTKKRKPPRRRVTLSGIRQTMVRGMVVEHLVEREGYILLEHLKPRLSRLADPAHKTAYLVMQYNGYRAATLREVLDRDFKNGLWVTSRVIVFDRRPKVMKKAARFIGEFIEVRDVREIVPRGLLRPHWRNPNEASRPRRARRT
jgi:hypothetical protein